MSNLEDTLRRGLTDLAAGMDAAPDLEQRIAHRRAARKLRRFHQKVVAASAAVVAVAVATVLATVSSGGHPQRVSTAVPAVTGPAVSGPASRQAAGSEPASGDVSAGRFTRTVILDGGTLTIRPAPSGSQPQITEAQAQVLVDSDSQVYSRGWDGAVGFGQVSISPKLAAGVKDVPAWVAVIQSRAPFCPNTRSASTPDTWSPGYLAVIVEGDGTRVLDYHSRSQVCDFPAEEPSVSDATQLVSIPWQTVSLQGQTLTFRYQKPACDPYAFKASGPSLSTGGDARTGKWTLEALLEAPYSLTYRDIIHCGGPWVTANTWIGPIPGGPGAPAPPGAIEVTHAPTGPAGATPGPVASGSK